MDTQLAAILLLVRMCESDMCGDSQTTKNGQNYQDIYPMLRPQPNFLAGKKKKENNGGLLALTRKAVGQQQGDRDRPMRIS